VKKSPEERIATPDPLVELRHQSMAQVIYEDNRVSCHDDSVIFVLMFPLCRACKESFMVPPAVRHCVIQETEIHSS